MRIWRRIRLSRRLEIRHIIHAWYVQLWLLILQCYSSKLRGKFIKSSPLRLRGGWSSRTKHTRPKFLCFTVIAFILYTSNISSRFQLYNSTPKHNDAHHVHHAPRPRYTSYKSFTNSFWTSTMKKTLFLIHQSYSRCQSQDPHSIQSLPPLPPCP